MAKKFKDLPPHSHFILKEEADSKGRATLMRKHAVSDLTPQAKNVLTFSNHRWELIFIDDGTRVIEILDCF